MSKQKLLAAYEQALTKPSEDNDQDVEDTSSSKRAKRLRKEFSSLNEHMDSVKQQSLDEFQKRRVLISMSRGITARYRHLTNDITKLLPHSKKEAKIDINKPSGDLGNKGFGVVSAMCEERKCEWAMFFEIRKHTNCYMWISRCPEGPSAKFLVENAHSMEELNMTGNCLEGSRPIMIFDPVFDSEPYLALLKTMFTSVFSTPDGHPKAKPFIDRCMCFYWEDGRVWIRNYQVIEEHHKDGRDRDLAEIGPRFVLNPIRFFHGAFGGPTLWKNEKYQRRVAKQNRRDVQTASQSEYVQRTIKKIKSQRYHDKVLKRDPSVLDGVFTKD